MKEMKENQNIRRGIIEMGINAQEDLLNAYIEEFEREWYEGSDGFDGVKWHTYLCDMLCDCYKIQTKLLYSDYYISNELTELINKWYDACNELLFDLNCWLRNKCGIKDVYTRIDKHIKEGK